MKLRNLQYFEKLIELENYSKVAEFFNVGQSTISMGVKRLEKDIGHSLLIHNYKHNVVILTPKGVMLHKHAKKFIQQLDEFTRHLKHDL